jgi:hypothetical protein
MNTYRIVNELLSGARVLQAPHHLLHEHAASPEFPGQDGHREFAILLAFVLALPSIGMIAEGFALHRPWLAFAGLGIFLGIAIFYVVTALVVLSGLD